MSRSPEDLKAQALIEAILFLESDPIGLGELIKLTELSREAVQLAVQDLQRRLKSDMYGLDLVELAGGFILIPKEELWHHLKDRYGKKNENRLSKAALETLSIIAYSQPLTKGEIEGIRGVSADGMIRVLLDRNYIRSVGKKDAPGKPIQYGTTKEFLKAFRLGSIADLPKLDEKNRERFELHG